MIGARADPPESRCELSERENLIELGSLSVTFDALSVHLLDPVYLLREHVLGKFIFKLNDPGESIVYITIIYAVAHLLRALCCSLLILIVPFTFFPFNENVSHEDSRRPDSRFILASVMSTVCQHIQPEPTSAIMMSLNDCLDGFDPLSEINISYVFGIDNSPMKDFCKKCHNNNSKNFLLDGQQNLQVSNAEEFLKKLNCPEEDTKVKVVSIFGNTCDGKSHTMNQVFFKGEEVFQTPSDKSCCMLGVWAAFDPILNVICLDTEGSVYINFCIF